jgi:hypothetical protein
VFAEPQVKTGTVPSLQDATEQVVTVFGQEAPSTASHL